jgi:protease-4
MEYADTYTRAQRTSVAIAYYLVALILCSCGCVEPLRVATLAHIEADGNINANANANVNGNIKTELAPTPKLQPVSAMSLPHRPANGDPVVAIIDVDGLLLNTDATGLGSWGENPVSVFRERLDSIECNPCVRAVVIRINTPGGSVTATDIMWRDLNAFRRRTGLPVVACMMDVGAGGGYYLATATNMIVAHPTSVVGGIGCVLNVYNLQDLMAQFNILGTPIKSGANIDVGSPIKALNEDQKRMLQNMADEFHDRFREVVTQARPDVDNNNATNFDGRVFTARQAMERRLIDKIGYLDNAVAAARAQAGVDCANVVFFHRREDPALSQYAITPNTPLQKSIIPANIPGLDRSRLPCFLYLWQMEPSAEVVSGK